MGGLLSSLQVTWSGLGKDSALNLTCWACTAQDTRRPHLLQEGEGHGGAEAEAQCPPPRDIMWKESVVGKLKEGSKLL